jgi:nucleoside-diphosphate-sugar epimerase
MRILFVGGTGLISSACSAEALAAGHELWLLNRGRSSLPPATAARLLQADARESIAWVDADPARQAVDQAANALCDRLACIYAEALSRAGRPAR